MELRNWRRKSLLRQSPLLPAQGRLPQSRSQRPLRSILAAFLILIPYARPVIKALRVIAADGIDYHLKFADRSPFDRLQALCRPGETALLTVGDLITDTTFTNIVCEDSSGALLTPASPLLQGTMRQHLLDSGLLRKADIRPEDLPGFTRIHLINAMNGLGDLTVAANSISHT